jgi:hypothetical protein
MEVFKVVRPMQNGEAGFRSVYAGGPFEARYCIGLKSMALPGLLEAGYGLTCFETAKRARRFQNAVEDNTVVLRCEADEPLELPGRRFPIRDSEDWVWSLEDPAGGPACQDLAELLRRRLGNKLEMLRHGIEERDYNVAPWPFGTLMVASLTPIEILDG